MSDVSVSVSGGAVAATVQSGFRDAASDGNTYGRRNGEWANIATTSALQFRQGTNADRLAMDPVPLIGEPIYTTDGNRLFIGDGSTVGGRGLVGDTDSYVICQPGDDIQAKYAEAKALTPGGSALSATNRAALIVFPGLYSISTVADGGPWESETNGTTVGLNIDTDYVDVLGLGSARWFSPCRITGSHPVIRIAASDVTVQGLANTISYGTAGGTSRRIVNCTATTLYSPVNVAGSDGLPAVIGGTLIGCRATTNMVGNASGTGLYNVFNGTLADCYADGFVCRNAVFQGVVRGGVFAITANSFSFRSFQGRFEHAAFPGLASAALWARSADGNSVPAAFAGTCTISNASPAVVTKSSHGLYSGVRVRFETDGALPTGLSTTTTYFVKVVDSNSFEVSATINGSSVNTTGAGSGSHSIVIPPGVEGGRYSYCTTSDGEFTTT